MNGKGGEPSRKVVAIWSSSGGTVCQRDVRGAAWLGSGRCCVTDGGCCDMRARLRADIAVEC